MREVAYSSCPDISSTNPPFSRRQDKYSLTKPADTVGEPQGLVFQCPNIFPGVDAARLKDQIQAIDPIMWHFVADTLNKPLNCHLLEFANSIRAFVVYSPWPLRAWTLH